jgi:inhibitor of KinA sporulation pathway (predicted exonuclease)
VRPAPDAAGASSAHDSFAILDLEYTSWAGARERKWGGPGEHREIVEIGLLLLDSATFAELGHLSRLVRPRINPRLSEYFCKLTGISQHEVDQAGDFASAEAAMCALLGEALADPARPRIWSFGEDGEIVAENYRLNDTTPRLAPGCFRDIRIDLTRALGLPERGVDSGELPRALGLAGYPPAHRALDDCRAIATALRVARDRGLNL